MVTEAGESSSPVSASPSALTLTPMRLVKTAAGAPFPAGTLTVASTLVLPGPTAVILPPSAVTIPGSPPLQSAVTLRVLPSL